MRDELKKHGMISWSELLADDVECAKRFYGTLFGWEMEDMQIGEGKYTVVRRNGEEIGGIMAKPAAAGDAPPHWATYITVDDTDATVAKAKELGATILLPPQDLPEIGRLAVILDPQGAIISIIAYAS